MPLHEFGRLSLCPSPASRALPPISGTGFCFESQLFYQFESSPTPFLCQNPQTKAARGSNLHPSICPKSVPTLGSSMESTVKVLATENFLQDEEIPRLEWRVATHKKGQKRRDLTHNTAAAQHNRPFFQLAPQHSSQLSPSCYSPAVHPTPSSSLPFLISRGGCGG